MIKIDTEQSLFGIWREHHFAFKEAYQNHSSSFIAYLLPEIAVGLSVFEVLDILQKRFGANQVREALNPAVSIPGPVAHETDAGWLKKANMIGLTSGLSEISSTWSNTS